MNWNIVENFSEEEFKCPCCGVADVSSYFMKKLQTARDYSRIPYSISSGCRCPSHNTEIGGDKNSEHITTMFKKCMGADIAVRDDRERFLILKGLILAGFKRIGIYEKHIHAGAKHNAPQKVAWYT